MRSSGVFALALSIACAAHAKNYHPVVTPRSYVRSQDSSLSSLLSDSLLTSFDASSSKSHLSNIMIPRVAGTENSTIVRTYIRSVFEKLEWHVEEDSFVDSTPYGDKTFTNLIFTKHPQASYRLVLAAHYDSKFFPEPPMDQFVGATDSALPCALLVDIAEFLDPMLSALGIHSLENLTSDLDGLDDDDNSEAGPETTLQIIFFDGEEAFKDWTDTDSLYGARHLADKWSNEYLPKGHALVKRKLFPNPTRLSGIESLVLLDLLGAPNPTVNSYFHETSWMFTNLQQAERRLFQANVLEFPGLSFVQSEDTTKWSSSATWFQDTGDLHYTFSVSDDHLPFLHRGVPILHLVAAPFPKVWHTIDDAGDALDSRTCAKWALLLRLFVQEYLGLEAHKTSTQHQRSELVCQGFVCSF